VKKSRNYLVVTICLLVSIFSSYSQEICDDGVDNDNDGLVDLNDLNDCSCASINAPNLSIIPNPSFESFSTLPTYISQTSLLNNWEKGTSATTDYFHTSGFYFPALPLPLPDGNGVIGTIVDLDFREYIATCLTSPFIAGQEYTLSFGIAGLSQNGSAPFPNCSFIDPITYGPLNITLYGINSCPTLPTSLNQLQCPVVAGWSELGYVTYTPNLSWNTVSITFVPSQNIQAIMLGAPCTLPVSYNNSGSCYAYLFMDNLLLSQNSEPIAVGVNQSGVYCDNTIVLQASSGAGGSWQWYFEGVALAGETNSALSINSNGNQAGLYTVSYSQGGLCGTENMIVNSVPCGLPVELSDFEVSCGLEETTVHWKTISESDNDYFELHYSENGFNFQTIALINGAGNSINPINYSHALRTEDYGNGYYRLKQVDYNGNYEFLGIIFNECTNDQILVSVSDGLLNVENYKTLFNCKVFDITGKELFNSPNFKLFRPTTMNAIYYVQIETDKGWSTHRLMNFE
jgi:hypothetical protein